MSYKKGIFPKRNPARKDLRNNKFAQFFADLGLTPTLDPFRHEPDMASQVAKVDGLLQQAHGLHADEKAAIEMMQRELAMLKTGVPTFPTTSAGRPDINGNSVTGLTLSFFTQELG